MPKTLLEVFGGKENEMGYYKQIEVELTDDDGHAERLKINRNNRRRGKVYENRAAQIVGGRRNLDKSRPHTDVENACSVYEIKATQQSTPKWQEGATRQLELAAAESEKAAGGVIKVYTKGAKARFFLIKEIFEGEGNMYHEGNEQSEPA